MHVYVAPKVCMARFPNTSNIYIYKSGLTVQGRRKNILVGFTVKITRSGNTYNKIQTTPITPHTPHTCHWYRHRSIRTTLSRSRDTAANVHPLFAPWSACGHRGCEGGRAHTGAHTGRHAASPVPDQMAHDVVQPVEPRSSGGSGHNAQDKACTCCDRRADARADPRRQRFRQPQAHITVSAAAQ